LPSCRTETPGAESLLEAADGVETITKEIERSRNTVATVADRKR
jgi:hypothetical protein